MKIKDLIPEDRPRERLLLSGARSLSNSELIAIIIGGGIGGKNVSEVARELLSMADAPMRSSVLGNCKLVQFSASKKQ